MEITSDTRTINGYSEVAGIKIQYSASVKTDERIDRITGSFIKDGGQARRDNEQGGCGGHRHSIL